MLQVQLQGHLFHQKLKLMWSHSWIIITNREFSKEEKWRVACQKVLGITLLQADLSTITHKALVAVLESIHQRNLDQVSFFPPLVCIWLQDHERLKDEEINMFLTLLSVVDRLPITILNYMQGNLVLISSDLFLIFYMCNANAWDISQMFEKEIWYIWLIPLFFWRKSMVALVTNK